MTGTCLTCGSDRLKSAPLPVITALVSAVIHRRRYRCADCGRTAWKHRLRRRSDSLASSLTQRETPEARAWWFFIVTVGMLVVASVLLVRDCEPPRQDVPVGLVLPSLNPANQR
jgi:hypothetical protein